ncbi:helix-turn-helix domain-containing protein [Cellvibrio sp. OA-2007]|uniref:helix-turn-helix domain-containing protein n=1 Tax=Cellvibrio sp. OA-2007 TaxID=529823 RepID=UPI000781C76C|nr:AraC family transcriptional regulator [Cellvibrio sp. OA-2007]
MKTPIFNIHDLILVLTLAVCVLLVIFQWVLSKQKAIASQLLSGFFVCVGASALGNLLLWNNYIGLHSDVAKMTLSLGLVIAVVAKSVCLYLYVVAITRANFSLRAKDGLHILNLLAVIGWVLWGDLDSDRLRFQSATHTENSVMLTNYLWHYLKFVPVIYAFAAALEIYRYKQQLKQFYSSLSLQGPYWLLLLTLGFALNWLWSLVVHLLGQTVSFSIADSFGIFDNYITFLLVNALFIYSLLYAHQLLETKDKPKEKEVAVAAEISPDVIARIRNTMEKQQLYLTQNLNIEDFARQVGIHYREVSSIINKEFNTNFFEFVNEYRVNRAKQMLLDPQYAQMTILDILLESGFNSKSSFHRFFKRYTGMSAAEFRKQNQV